LIKIVLVFICNVFVKIVLYALAIYRSACFCINFNLIVIVFLSFFSFINVYYAIALCESINFKIVKYICFLVASKRLQVLLIIICDVCYFIVSFVSICRKCDLNRSLLFNWIFNTFMSCLISTSWFVNVTFTIISYLFDVLVK